VGDAPEQGFELDVEIVSKLDRPGPGKSSRQPRRQSQDNSWAIYATRVGSWSSPAASPPEDNGTWSGGWQNPAWSRGAS
jgi:hypothetical protein